MRRRAALLATLSLLLTPGMPVSAAAVAPRTGFERSAGAAWTSLAEEARFLRTVDAASARVRVSVAGRTERGRAIRLVQIGDEPAAHRVLLVCSQHGDEPAGREACLRTVRDLAAAGDRRTRRLLEGTTVLVVPTANPDGVASGRRGNALDVDVNRDHRELVTPEARALDRVLRQWRPGVLLDLHEYGGTPGVSDRDLTYLGPQHAGVDPAVRARAGELAARFLVPAVDRAGFSTGVFAGDEDPRTLRTWAALHGVVTLLLETRVDRGREADASGRVRRVDSALAGIRAVLLAPGCDARASVAGCATTREPWSDGAR